MSHHPARPPFHVSEEEGGTAVRFTPGTVLTDADIEALGRRLTARTGWQECAPVTLDLGGVAALSSGALGKLLALNRACLDDLLAGAGR